MSIVQIEAALNRLSAEELRRLALSSWAAFVKKEELDTRCNECDEDNPALLAALDDAVRRAERPGARGASAAEVRSRIREWTTR